MRSLSLDWPGAGIGAAEPIVSALTTACGRPHRSVVGTDPAGSVAAMNPSSAQAGRDADAGPGKTSGASRDAIGRLHLAAAIGNEIGRASCRERV